MWHSKMVLTESGDSKDLMGRKKRTKQKEMKSLNKASLPKADTRIEIFRKRPFSACRCLRPSLWPAVACWQMFRWHGLWFLLKADRQTTPCTQVLFKIWCKRNDVTEMKNVGFFFSQHKSPTLNIHLHLHQHISPHVSCTRTTCAFISCLYQHRGGEFYESRILNKTFLRVVFPPETVINTPSNQPVEFQTKKPQIWMKLEAQSERFRPGNNGVLALVIVARQSEEIQWPP